MYNSTMNLTQTVTQILATLTLVSDIALIAGVLLFIFVHGNLKKLLKINIFGVMAKNARILSFIVALTAMLGSLFYSDIAGFEPCKLCWYQRILMYPMVLLLGMAIAKNDRKNIVDYCLWLSGIGAAIASYHYYLQRGGNEFIPCSTVGYSVSCAKTFVMSYGYITIPVMALTAFLLIFSAMLLQKLLNKSAR